ncbi:MAG: beta-propeller fold lactonase family protein [Candidatus Sulfotelmatobacter sp.]
MSLLLLAGCGGGTNPPVSRGSNPTPTITAISPNSTVAGGAAFTLTINGTNFVAASTVNFGGSATATTFVNSTQLTAAIPAASINSTGVPAVTVTNPAPGGGTSKAINFTITSGSPSSVPTISVLDPTGVPAGEPSFQLQVVGPYPGSNFVAGSVVRWNGSNRPTTSDAINGLVAQISASDIAAAGAAAVTVFNPGPGGGTSNALTFTITTGSVDPQSIALDPTGKFAYVMDGGSDGDGGYVSMYTISPTTGALASIGPPVSTYGYGVYYGSGVNAGSVAVDPLGKFAYITNAGDVYDYGDGADGSIAIYAINAATGALTSTGTINGNCPGLCLPSSVIVDPSGRLAYVANGGGGVPFNVAMYSINGTTGALTSSGTIAAGTDPLSAAVDPAGKFAYVANWTGYDTDGGVSMYTIDPTTGGLTPIGTIATEVSPTSIAIHPSGKFAYVTNSGSNDVSMYSIDATTGALTSIGSIAAGTDPVSVAVDPAGKFAYVANWTEYDTDGSVSMYTIDATTGVLTPSGTIATEVSPTSIAIHPSGKFAYVTNSGSNNVSMYSIDSATGTLTLIGTIGT